MLLEKHSTAFFTVCRRDQGWIHRRPVRLQVIVELKVREPARHFSVESLKDALTDHIICLPLHLVIAWDNWVLAQTVVSLADQMSFRLGMPSVTCLDASESHIRCRVRDSIIGWNNFNRVVSGLSRRLNKLDGALHSTAQILDQSLVNRYVSVLLSGRPILGSLVISVSFFPLCLARDLIKVDACFQAGNLACLMHILQLLHEFQSWRAARAEILQLVPVLWQLLCEVYSLHVSCAVLNWRVRCRS